MAEIFEEAIRDRLVDVWLEEYFIRIKDIPNGELLPRLPHHHLANQIITEAAKEAILNNTINFRIGIVHTTIDVAWHYIRDMVLVGRSQVNYLPNEAMVADSLTKPLTTAMFVLWVCKNEPIRTSKSRGVLRYDVSDDSEEHRTERVEAALRELIAKEYVVSRSVNT